MSEQRSNIVCLATWKAGQHKEKENHPPQAQQTSTCTALVPVKKKNVGDAFFLEKFITDFTFIQSKGKTWAIRIRFAFLPKHAAGILQFFQLSDVVYISYGPCQYKIGTPIVEEPLELDDDTIEIVVLGNLLSHR